MEDFYDYSWQLYITKLAATVSTYRRILYRIMIPT
jgi:hypothetical protein